MEEDSVSFDSIFDLDDLENDQILLRRATIQDSSYNQAMYTRNVVCEHLQNKDGAPFEKGMEWGPLALTGASAAELGLLQDVSEYSTSDSSRFMQDHSDSLGHSNQYRPHAASPGTVGELEPFQTCPEYSPTASNEYTQRENQEGAQPCSQMGAGSFAAARASVVELGPTRGENDACCTQRELLALHNSYARLNELCKHRQEHGHCNVSQKDENQRLSNWVNKMRMQKKRFDKGEKCLLTTEMVEHLEGLGFEWAIRRDEKWESCYLILKRFKRVHGHCNVPTKSSATLEMKKLGRWVTEQRSKYKKGKLAPERMGKLEKLDFNWNAC